MCTPYAKEDECSEGSWSEADTEESYIPRSEKALYLGMRVALAIVLICFVYFTFTSRELVPEPTIPEPVLPTPEPVLPTPEPILDAAESFLNYLQEQDKADKGEPIVVRMCVG